jgi:phosphoribosylanthranilate isomerase
VGQENPKTRIKICGITRVEDAIAAVPVGADYLGLNFCPSSPRRLEISQARKIASAVAGQVRLVAVLVNSASQEIEEILAEVPVDLLQFRGDETVEEIAPFTERAIKVVRFENRLDSDLVTAFGDVWGFLVEARRPGLYGGTGKGWDYGQVAEVDWGRPCFLAGGLEPENVAVAVERSGAWGVDVASGVESEPGIKDPDRMKRFVEEVRRAQT